MTATPDEPRDTESNPIVIRLIAGERIVRGILLLIGGAYLLTHSGSDFGKLAYRFMRALELDPRRPFLHHLIEKLHRLRAGTVVITGIAAIGYGVLETIEGIGLWLERFWAEWLTVIATSLLIPLEVYEVVRHPSVLKGGGIIVNLLIVAYLARRLRHRIREERGRRPVGSDA